MRKWVGAVVVVTLLAAIAIYAAFPHPTHDQAELRALATQSRHLLARYKDRPGAVPKSQWPHEIAALQPANVIVREGAVEITTKRYFDGGWGYGFAPDKRDLGMLPACWSSLGQDMYWHGPC